MRFRFCGDGDCPDWILVQINTLARMSSIKMKLLCQVVADSLVEGTSINYEKAKKLTSDAKFDEEEVKATVSALTYILTSAAKYGVPETTLANELQQTQNSQFTHRDSLQNSPVIKLPKTQNSQFTHRDSLQNSPVIKLPKIGFPREHGQALCRVYSERAAAVTSQLARRSLRTSRLVDVATQRRGSLSILTLTYWSAETSREHKRTFAVTHTQLATLLHDLKLCSEKLQSLENEL